MGRSPCCDEGVHVKKGPWTPEEDKKLVDYITLHGHRSWRHLPKKAGLNRCGKSCRLRWTNYLRPDIRRGNFSPDEERQIVHLHSLLGNKWSKISAHLPGRTDNEIKNYWNTHLRKKLLAVGIDPATHRRRPDLDALSALLRDAAAAVNPASSDIALRLRADAVQYLAALQVLESFVKLMNPPPPLLLPSLDTAISQLLGGRVDDVVGSPNPVELPSPNEAAASDDPSGMNGPVLNGCSIPPSLASASADENRQVAECMQEYDQQQNTDEDLFSWNDILEQISWSDEPQSFPFRTEEKKKD